MEPYLKKTRRHYDSAFAWGVMCRYPDQRMILELLFDSELELEEVCKIAIIQIVGQLGIAIEHGLALPNVQSAEPYRRHAGLLDVIIRQSFKTREHVNLRRFYSLGFDFGLLLWSWYFEDLEGDSTNADRLFTHLSSQPTELRAAFEPINSLISEGRTDGFKIERVPNRNRVLSIVDKVCTKLRPLVLEIQATPLEKIPDKTIAQFGRVYLLEHRKKDLNVFIKGDGYYCLTEIRHSVIRALVEAGENGLTKDELTDRSGAEDGYGTFRQIKAKEPWDVILQSPGKKGQGGYRIAPY